MDGSSLFLGVPVCMTRTKPLIGYTKKQPKSKIIIMLRFRSWNCSAVYLCTYLSSRSRMLYLRLSLRGIGQIGGFMRVVKVVIHPLFMRVSGESSSGTSSFFICRWCPTQIFCCCTRIDPRFTVLSCRLFGSIGSTIHYRP